MSCHFVILSFCQSAWPCRDFTVVVEAPLGTNMTLFRLPEVGTAWLPPRYRTSCLADGEVRDEGKSLEGSKSLKLSL